MTVDQPTTSISYQDFISKQSRYFTLTTKNPETAKRLFTAAESYAKKRLAKYVKMTIK